jgi:hypothetical protein
MVGAAADAPKVPLFPYPEASAAVVPEVSSSFQYPTSPSLRMRWLKVSPPEAKVLLAVVVLSKTVPLLWTKFALPVSLKAPPMTRVALVEVKVAVPEREKLPPMPILALLPVKVPAAWEYAPEVVMVLPALWVMVPV